MHQVRVNVLELFFLNFLNLKIYISWLKYWLFRKTHVTMQCICLRCSKTTLHIIPRLHFLQREYSALLTSQRAEQLWYFVSVRSVSLKLNNFRSIFWNFSWLWLFKYWFVWGFRKNYIKTTELLDFLWRNISCSPYSSKMDCSIRWYLCTPCRSQNVLAPLPCFGMSPGSDHFKYWFIWSVS